MPAVVDDELGRRRNVPTWGCGRLDIEQPIEEPVNESVGDSMSAVTGVHLPIQYVQLYVQAALHIPHHLRLYAPIGVLREFHHDTVELFVLL